MVANYGISRGLGDDDGAVELRRQQTLHPRLAGKDYRRRPRQGDPHCPRICRQRRQDPRAFHDHRRCRYEPLVPHGHELPQPDQHADPVWLRWPERRWLGPLCRPGKTASADRLAAAGLWPGLAASATPHERHLVLLCPLRAMALREAGRGRDPVTAGGQVEVWRQPDRLQRARRAHGLAAVRTPAQPQPADHRRGR